MELKRLLELAGAPISEAKKDDESDDKCEKCECDPCECDKDDDDEGVTKGLMNRKQPILTGMCFL